MSLTSDGGWVGAFQDEKRERAQRLFVSGLVHELLAS
jgi:hypothetical protein